jgi:hypothetical protein
VVGAGVVATLAACQLFVIPVADLVTGLTKVSELTAVGTHGASYLVRKNLEDSARSLLGAVLLGLPLLAGLLAARRAARDGNERAAGALLGGAAVVTVLLPFLLGWHGGNHRGTAVVDVALAALLVALLAGLLAAGRPVGRDPVGALVAGTLFLVPLLQAAGTNVAVAYVALECAAMWVGLVVLTLARSGPSTVMTTAVLLDLGVAVVATALICGSNTVMTPFRSDGLDASRSRVPQLGLDVSPDLARQLEAVARALAPYVEPGSTPVLSMDRDAGLTYLVGGVPAGSPWNDPSSPTRTAGILELACDRGDVRRAPVLLLTRPVDHDVAHAMTECGFPFPEDYRHLSVTGGPPMLTVYVPRNGS